VLRRLFTRGTGSARTSIYEHVKTHARRDGPGLDEAGETLPDETDLTGPIRFAPGALDGIPLAHASVQTGPQLERTLRLILDAARAFRIDRFASTWASAEANALMRSCMGRDVHTGRQTTSHALTASPKPFSRSLRLAPNSNLVPVARSRTALAARMVRAAAFDDSRAAS
jgi:hypothetical protein